MPPPFSKAAPPPKTLKTPEVLAAYEAVLSDRAETDWLLISTVPDAANNKTDVVVETGTGGLETLAGRLDDSQRQYGYARVEYANDKESKRIKFVLVFWAGPQAKGGVFSALAQQNELLASFHKHGNPFNTSDRSDLALDEVVKLLRKSGGADYNGGRG